jgi:hypothetical protein
MDNCLQNCGACSLTYCVILVKQAAHLFEYWYLVIQVHRMLGPAVNECKGQVFSNLELSVDGVHHRARKSCLIPAMFWGQCFRLFVFVTH